MHPSAIRLRRSVLITPGNNAELLRKTTRSQADVTTIDWEDGVADSQKPAARAITREILEEVSWGEQEVCIRINSLDSPFALDDLDAVADLPVDSIRLPKARSKDDVLHVVERLDALESAKRPASLKPLEIWVNIETPSALVNVEEIAAAHPRLTALLIAEGDLGAGLHVKRLQLGPNRTLGPIRYEYLYAEGRVVAAARANGLDPIATGFAAVGDLDGTRQQAVFSAQQGFSGSVIFSPKQAEVVNGAFMPSPDDLDWARSVVSAFDEATAQQRTVSVIQQEMTDRPHVQNAERLLAMDAQVRGAR
jgi:citrate lyase beta subunit